MTPHIDAKNGAYANLTLFPGDPKRAEFLADKLLKNTKIVNEVRGCFGFTGFYYGKKVSIQASGMGMPSASIYAYELFQNYNVKKLVRIGSCGSYKANINIGDWTLSKLAVTRSNIFDQSANMLVTGGHRQASPCSALFSQVLSSQKFKPVIVHSSDEFYSFGDQSAQFNADVVEMESFALFYIAKRFNRSALSVNLCSDSVNSGGAEMSPSQRVEKTLEMTEEVLKTLCME